MYNNEDKQPKCALMIHLKFICGLQVSIYISPIFFCIFYLGIMSLNEVIHLAKNFYGLTFVVSLPATAL